MFNVELLDSAEKYRLKDVKFVYDDTEGKLIVERGGEEVLLHMIRKYPILLINREGSVNIQNITEELYPQAQNQIGSLPKFEEAYVLSNIITGRIITIQKVENGEITLNDGTTITPDYYFQHGNDHFFASLERNIIYYGITYTGPDQYTPTAFIMDPQGQPDPALPVRTVTIEQGELILIGDTPIAIANETKARPQTPDNTPSGEIQ